MAAVLAQPKSCISITCHFVLLEIFFKNTFLLLYLSRSEILKAG